MICQICNNNYEGHFNSKSCSKQCQNELKKRINEQYNNKKRIEKENLITDLDGEEWKCIKGFDELYKISNKGRVKSKYRKGGGGILKNKMGKNGYFTVGLRINNKLKHFTIHRLIALHFIPNINNYPCVDHIDRCKTNNNINNLRWVDFKTNILNSKRCDVSRCLMRTCDNVNGKKYYGFRSSVNGKSKRNISLVKACCWIFENNVFLMKHITKN